MNKQVIINNLNTSKKNCVIVSVGDWKLAIVNCCYELLLILYLHLLVYDDTYNKYLWGFKVCM